MPNLPQPERHVAPILAGLAVVLALAGQYILTLGSTPDPWALPCFALAIACLLLAERLARR
jgi:hypothetical protein